MDIQSVKRHIAVTERLIREAKARNDAGRLVRLRREAKQLCEMRRRFGKPGSPQRRPNRNEVRAMFAAYADGMAEK